MTRSLLTYTATAQIQGIEHVLVGATIHVYEQGTSTPVAATLWDSSTSGSGQANPFTTPANGTISFWLDTPQFVDLVISKAGFSTLRETVAVGDPAGGAGSPDPVDAAAGTASLRTLGTGAQQAAAGSHSHTLDGLSDVAVTAAASSQDLVYNGSGWVNISHKKRPRGYAGYTGDGTADDSAVWASMVADIVAAGRGYIECHPSDTFAMKNAELATRLIVEGNGAKVLLHTSATNSDDLFRTTNFNTLIGTTTAVGSGAPWGFELRDLYIEQPTDNTGRHTIAIYGTSYQLRHLKITHRGIGSAIRNDYGVQTADWTVNQPNQYETFNSIVFDHINILDAGSTAGVNAAATNARPSVNVSTVSNTTNPTITTARPHFLNVGQTVIIASVGGATGVNGTWTVLATPSSTTFTITTAAPGAYTSGGTITYDVSATWYHSGPSDGHADEIYIAASTHVAGRRGLLMNKSQNGAAGSATGLDIGKMHVYNNYDVAVDINSGGMQIANAQFEGSFKCCLLIRGGNGRSNIRGRVYGGQGGVTLVSLRDSNHNSFGELLLHQAGSGNAPPSGYNNVYWENYSSGNLDGSMMMQHDYNTNAKAASGSIPGQSPGFTAFLNAFGISSATLSADFGAVNSATTWQYQGAGQSQSAAAPDPGANGTISTSSLRVARVSPAAARAGVILAAGTEPGQRITVINEAAAANTITFDVAGTSNVADGVTTVIPGLRASLFVWDSSTSRWYRTA